MSVRDLMLSPAERAGLPSLDFTKKELAALGVAANLGTIWQRMTSREAIELKQRVRDGLKPEFWYEPDVESPMWTGYCKLSKASKRDSVIHGNVHHMFFTMVELGGVWESLGDFVDKSLGFARPDGTLRQAVYIAYAKEKWGCHRVDGEFVNREWDVPPEFRSLMKSPDGRRRMAQILTSGDHCLEFPFEVPPIVRRYIANGGHL